MKFVMSAYLSIVLLIVYVGYFELNPSPIYKIGDCYSNMYSSGEFLPQKRSPFFYEVLKVGKKNYLVQPYYRYESGRISKENIEEENFKYAHVNSFLVNCKTGDKL